jgi:hypothetical protein
MFRRALILALSGLALGLTARLAGAAEIRPPTDLLLREGDDPAWAAPAVDDPTPWESVTFSDLPRPGGLQWIRGSLELDPEDVSEPVGIRVTALAAWELFFDGRPLGGSGVVGHSRASERAGVLDRMLLVPPDLARPGPHVLAIRCSTFTPTDRAAGFWMVVGPYAEIVLLPRQGLVLAAAHLGALLLIAAWAAVSWLGERRDRSDFWLAAFAIATLVFAANIVWRRLPGYNWEWQSLRTTLYVVATFVRGFSLVAFVTTRFSLGRLGRACRLAFLAATPLLFLSTKTWQDYLAASELLALASVAFVVATAIQRRRWALASLALPVTYFCYLILSSPWNYLTSGLFWGTDLMFVGLLVSQALDHRRGRELRLQAVQRSRRLELEMQRRHLQPHFLMNTLTTLSEQLVEAGDEAEAIIVALAEEIHLLGDLTRAPLVRLADEIRLCSTHLEVMSLHRRRRFSLATAAIDPQQAIPPAVLHTLLENALTHNRYTRPEVEFRLEQVDCEGTLEPGALRSVALQLSCPLAPREEPQGEHTAARRHGLGRQYIEARLEESFPGAWRFEERSSGNQWMSRLRIPRRALSPPLAAALRTGHSGLAALGES